jgi:hypothetical protein
MTSNFDCFVFFSLRLMTPYDEKLMLKRLNKIMHVEPVSSTETPLPPWEAERIKQTRNVLRRKLIVRKVTNNCCFKYFGIILLCVCVCAPACVRASVCSFLKIK